jgi:CheY-like chemotaxis protein
MAAKILIIEDNERNRAILRDILVFAGYEVIEAPNGREGLESARKNLPALVLLDIQMPGMDGYEVGRTLKADPSTKNIIIIAVTSYAMEGDKAKILAAGIDDYVSKPYDIMDMLELVKKKVAPAP